MAVEIVSNHNSFFIGKRRFVAAFACLLLVVFVIAHRTHGVLGLGIETAQLWIFPGILFLSVLLVRAELKIPLIVPIAAAIFGGAALFYSYLWEGRLSGQFVFAKFEGDDREEVSTLFREAVHDGGIPFQITRMSRVFHSQAEVEDAFKYNNEVRGVVWGSKDWINVSFPHITNRSIVDLDAGSLASRLPKLQLVTEVPVLGMSVSREDLSYNLSVYFVRELFSALSLGEHDSGGKLVTDNFSPEVAFLVAAQHAGPWINLSHKAYPWFRIGTDHLSESVKGGVYQSGEMSCALNSLTEGRRLSPPENNAELYAAIKNNEGVGMYVKGVLENDATSKKFAVKAFQLAIRSAKLPNRDNVAYNAYKVAKANLDRVRLYK